MAVLTGSDAPAATAAPAAASSSTQEAVASSSSTEEAASSTYEAPASTSSTYEAPTSTSVYVAPTPTSTYVAPTTSEAPAPAATTAETQNTASTGGDVHYGQATFFYQNGVSGACGQVNSDSTPLVALPAKFWNYNGGSQPSQYCGQYIQVTRGDRTVNALVADLCPVGFCPAPNNLFECSNSISYRLVSEPTRSICLPELSTKSLLPMKARFQFLGSSSKGA